MEGITVLVAVGIAVALGTLVGVVVIDGLDVGVIRAIRPAVGIEVCVTSM